MKTFRITGLWALCMTLLCLPGLTSCDDEASKDSHFIYFSTTEPYTRIGGVECNIDNLSGEISNLYPLPAGTDLKALKIWFVTNHENEGVFVKGVRQHSGSTINDFSAPVEYEIRTEKEIRKYTVRFTVSATCNTQAGVKLERHTDFIRAIDSDQAWRLSEAVQASEVNFTTTTGHKLKLCLFEVDLTSPSVVVRTTLPDDGNEWGMQHMIDQAKALDNSGKTVLGAINGDYFDWNNGNGSGEPEGVVCRDGVYLKETFDLPGIGSFFGIREDGRAAVGSYDEFLLVKDKLRNAIGGRKRLVVNAGPVAGLDDDASLANRTAIGMSSLDLRTMYAVVVEGLDDTDQKGIKLAELASCMIKLGVGHAINLEGGDSSTFVIKKEEGLTALNRSADRLRKVGNGIAIIQNK